MRGSLLTLVAIAGIAGGCAAEIGGGSSFEERPDLGVTALKARIEGGLSSPIHFEVESGVQSILIEVEGDRGLYSLVELTTPGGRNLIEDASFTTRSSRGNYGLANWMYPNSPGIDVQPGPYRMVIRGMATQDGGNVSEDVSIRIYQKRFWEDAECGVHIDFLVDQSALALADVEEAMQRITGQANNLLAQAGVTIVDYSLVRINLSSLDVDPEDGSVLPVVDDVLAQAQRQGLSRPGSVHVLLVRSIGGSDPKGRALGLPGPYNSASPNSAVLVSTSSFVDTSGFLDTDGVAETLTHELGHYMGLYHTSEATGDKHDPIPDTDECGTGLCSQDYNDNIMSTGSPGPRFELSDGQAEIMRNHPLCTPLSMTNYQPPPPPPECTLDCTAPETCAIWNGAQLCLEACEPELDQCDTLCTTSDDGVYVCRP